MSQTNPPSRQAACDTNTSPIPLRSPVTTQKLTPTEGLTILEQQRLKRPTSPHLAIYDKAQTYFGASIFQRYTGGALSGAVYLYATAYLAAPLLGWHLESQSLVAAFAGLSVATKTGLKLAFAWPFVFHFMNGVRHLTYDMALGFQKPTIKKGMYVVWTASIITTIGLLFV